MNDLEMVQRFSRTSFWLGLGVLKRTKNGQSARADGGSMGPSALDRKSGDAQTRVRSGQISRGRLRVPRQWQCHRNTVRRVHRTPLGGGWDRPFSLSVAGCRGLLG
jgi:hypothetical protein